VDVLVPVDLEPGPPPLRARFIEPTAVAPRYTALREGLREQGIQVGAWQSAASVANPSPGWNCHGGPNPVWVGIHGALENPGLRARAPSGWGWRWWSFCWRRPGSAASWPAPAGIAAQRELAETGERRRRSNRAGRRSCAS
jgi:hypothetical protein